MSNTVSPEQLAANRANSANSTGPRTPEGKARSSQNARKHGFTATNFAVVRLEDLNEVANLLEDLVALYHPVNSQELFAVERIALAQQAILRAARLEAGFLSNCLGESLDTRGEFRPPSHSQVAVEIETNQAQERNFRLADGFHRLITQSNSFALLLRYQAQAERQYRRAIEEFERLKVLREELRNEPNSEGVSRPNPKKKNPFTHLAKRTQFPPATPPPRRALPPGPPTEPPARRRFGPSGTPPL